MAKITREQAQKWDAQARGDFHFDVRQYAIWGEKELRRTIELDGGDVLELRLEYRAEYVMRTNSHGVKWNERTGLHIPVLRVSIWHPTRESETFFSRGLG